MQSTLEVRSALPAADRRKPSPPLLFVHGAYCDAWCWDVHILPWFAAQGYAAYALSLRGHGRSPGHDQIGSLHLGDYADDIRSVAAGLADGSDLSSKPILIGHSMGAALVERIIASDEHPGAVLISPVPPSGLLPVLTRLWWGRPEFFWHAPSLSGAHLVPVAAPTLREFYFTRNVPREILAETMRHLSPESQQAVMQLAWRGQPRRPVGATPVCVIAGAEDALFRPADAAATAHRYGTEAIVLEGLPHMMMLEPGWERLAQALERWITQSVPAAQRAPVRSPSAKARGR